MKATNEERLAIDGGMPVRTTPMPRWPAFSQDEIDAAAAVLRSGAINYWTGEEGRRFEREGQAGGYQVSSLRSERMRYSR